MVTQAEAIKRSEAVGLTDISPSLDFREQTVLVTGGAAGIGAAISKMAHKLGATVIAIDVQDKELKKLEDELGSDRFIGIEFDLSQSAADSDAYDQLAEKILDASHNGVVDSYIMNAGVVKLSEDTNGISGTSAKEFQTISQINAWSHGDIYRAIADQMAEDARIVVTSSPIVGRADPKTPGYAISKGLLEGIANQIFGEVEGTGKTVLAYTPPPVQNYLRAGLKPSEPPYAHPFGEDMAELPLRLASRGVNQDLAGKVIAMGYSDLRFTDGVTEDGRKFDYMPRDPDTNGFLYDLRIRNIAEGGGDGGDHIGYWDTDSSRHIQGLGRTPDLDLNAALDDQFKAPDHVKKHRPK